MSENKNNVRLGDGVANNMKEAANKAVIDIAKEFINVFTDFAKEKAKDAPEKIGEWLNSKKVQDELVELWSNKLFQDGLISKGYAGLPEELLISNFRQEILLFQLLKSLLHPVQSFLRIQFELLRGLSHSRKTSP